MYNKYFLAFALLFPLLAFGAWLIDIEHDLNTEKTVVIRMRGYDPVDLLSGRYLLLRPDWDHTDCTQFTDGICPRNQFAQSYRYYLPEDAAKNLDHLLVQKQPQTDIVFTYHPKASPMVKELLIDGSIWQEWLNLLPKQPD